MGDTKTGRRLGGVLGGVFLLALILGPGPGAGWVDGTAEEPRIWFGVPALYVWVVFWYVVMAGCVVVAAKRLWRDED
ncbi:MAG: hypothetical protein O3A92_05135 [Verrucomicrobia bacterium]|nr:hypothetical protein [Verrucomicrobiota bacterium]